MSPGLIVLIVGIVLMLIGVIALVMARMAVGRVRTMTATQTTQLSDLLPGFESLREELGGGPSEMGKTVELKGIVECDDPLTAELSQKTAAIVQTSISRDVEVRRLHRDSHGHTSHRWVRETEHIHSDRSESPFFLNDGTGRVRIRPDGSSLDLAEVVDRFELANNVEQSSGTLSLGSFSFSFSTTLGSDKRIIGYRFQESILPVGTELYVLGELSDTGDGLAVRDPAESGQTFIVSTKSEETLVRSGQSTAKWGKIGGISALAIGTIGTVVGIILLIVG